MFQFPRAANIIMRFEGFSERAIPDPVTGQMPFTFGYGCQNYPNGGPVRQGQRVTEEKAKEYLQLEMKQIAEDLDDLDLPIIDRNQQEALISFIHSIGWTPFLYSEIIDKIESGAEIRVPEEFMRWVFGPDHKVIGGLLDRRREEAALFSISMEQPPWMTGDILLAAFRNYQAHPDQVNAIRDLEKQVNPYTLAAFHAEFSKGTNLKDIMTYEELAGIFDL
jgi:lysozyme